MPAAARPPTAAALAALAALLALVASCARPPGAPADGAARIADGSAARPRVVFLGSSTTAGAGATRPERRWTSLLAGRLGWLEVNRGLADSTLTAIGRKVPSGEERWRGAVSGEPAALVLVMYGANDVLARVPLGDAATPGTFRHAAARVLRGIREALPRATLVVLSPQPSRATAAERAPYDAALAEAALAVGAAFVPAGAAFPEDRLDALAADRLHLNDAGHAALAAFLAERRALFAAAAPAARREGPPGAPR